jgi:hypothetical protein
VSVSPGGNSESNNNNNNKRIHTHIEDVKQLKAPYHVHAEETIYSSLLLNNIITS